MARQRLSFAHKTILGTDLSNYIVVDDPVYGAPGAPAIVWAEAGDDTVHGGAGDDGIYGGGNDDVIVGAGGADFLDGGNGDNWTFGEYFVDPADYDAPQ